jgi:hypothetical protein
VEGLGTVVVTDILREGVIRIDPVTGDRTIAPVCPAPQLVGGGPAFLGLVAVAVEREGTLVAIDLGRPALMSVHPVSGDRTMLSQ